MTAWFTRVTGLVLLLIVASAMTWTTANANERYGKQKVVYHINYTGGQDDKAYFGALRNIRNHIKAVGAENLDLKVILHGKGLNLLLDAVKNLELQSAVADLKTQKVEFHVCANTLRGRKIDYAKDLFEVVEGDIVPSGVAELARLQLMGYAYIKP